MKYYIKKTIFCALNDKKVKGPICVIYYLYLLTAAYIS